MKSTNTTGIISLTRLQEFLFSLETDHTIDSKHFPITCAFLFQTDFGPNRFYFLLFIIFIPLKFIALLMHRFTLSSLLLFSFFPDGTLQHISPMYAYGDTKLRCRSVQQIASGYSQHVFTALASILIPPAFPCDKQKKSKGSFQLVRSLASIISSLICLDLGGRHQQWLQEIMKQD